MFFAHDTEVALQEAADLVNTLGRDGQDRLATTAELAAWVRRWRWSGVLRLDESELDSVRALRPRLRRLWEGEEQDVVEEVNQMLHDGGAQPRLVRHDDWDWHLHATPDDAPLTRRLTVEVAMAMVDLVRADGLGRLGVCEAQDCEKVLVDLTRNRSRRFCSTTCGNRVAAAAYRGRRAAAAADD
ncbi:CGNR zinc finger domain-containing protein [Ornithinimicrobium avium]|uniref:CGNR zinc finger domain-containing protein n=1 Tax=Ornithinimicrobium avium TaxID=2283195 RepID=A0A345NN87_9MICO|nr:CGNR zinc finger domain-containing protein [Ornithinimicrobium avium]AXH96495.1 CGNR zinc finger domain-containing protein [Ornithinimicrobium avium]